MITITSLAAKTLKALRLSESPLYRRGLKHGIAASVEHQNALRTLSVRSVIDVGANKGQFSLLARQLFPQAFIHAFEPLLEPAARYRQLFADDHAVCLHEMALGATATMTEIHISGRDDSSSLLAILPRQESLYPGTAEIEKRVIQVVKGDDLIDYRTLEPPLLIKLDVQGYEKEVLAGMPKILEKADYVYAEISFQQLYANQVLAADLISYLYSRGLHLQSIYNLSSDENGHSVYADALFSRTS